MCVECMCGGDIVGRSTPIMCTGDDISWVGREGSGLAPLSLNDSTLPYLSESPSTINFRLVHH